MELNELREKLKTFRPKFLMEHCGVSRQTIYNFIHKGWNIRPETIEKLKELVQ